MVDSLIKELKAWPQYTVQAILAPRGQHGPPANGIIVTTHDAS